MSRINRTDLVSDNSIVHARIQINNGEFFFKKNNHFKLWQKWAILYLKKYPSVKITTYQWMNNHCHLLIEVDKSLDLSRFLHDLNWRFAFEFNKINQRKGHFFQSRFKCSVIDSDEYEMIAQRYIHRNQLRAKMIPHMKQAKWSSYHFYAYGKPDPLITPFRTYDSFGLNEKIRRLQFRQFIETMMEHEEYEWKQRLNHPHLKSKKDFMKNYLYKSGEG